jgi:hypothetical protein
MLHRNTPKLIKNKNLNNSSLAAHKPKRIKENTAFICSITIVSDKVRSLCD